ncbi:MAG: hypothetical protein OHK0012_12680 [Synechococcales cyanobacterium]
MTMNLKSWQGLLPFLVLTTIISSDWKAFGQSLTPPPLPVVQPSPSPAPDPAHSPSAEPGSLASRQVQILAPADGAVLPNPATSVVVRYPVGQVITLTLNGDPVDPQLIGRTETDNATGMITQTWYGIGLSQTQNILAVQDRTSQALLSQISIAVAGLPESLLVQSREASIPADGRSTATITGRFLDDQGHPSPFATLVTLVASAGEWVGEDASLEQPGFQVAASQGQFTAILQSALQGQTVRIQAVAGNLEAFTQFQMTTNLRPSIATGVIDFRLGQRGTHFYRSFQEFMPADGSFATDLDFSSAAFVTGSLGEWLFTGAFNSSRPLNANRDRHSQLFRDTQFLEQGYPIYGDQSRTEILTPSKDSLYLRFERTSPVTNASPDYVMWGDYDLPEFSLGNQQLTGITRTLHGFKGNYTYDNLQLTALYSNDTDGFQRDILAPNGTRGFYFLSQRPLISGSENVFIEQEKQFEPGTIVNRIPLSRSLDYEIDYDRGTLFFRDPVPRLLTDPLTGETLIQRIVVTYQFQGLNGSTSIFAARARYFFSRETDLESWLGITYFQENQGSRQFQLRGADLYIPLGKDGQVIGEYAHSTQAADLQGEVNGSAYRISAEGWFNEQLWAKAYWSQTDPGFVNNATVSFVAGQTRYGAQIKALLSPETSVNASYEHLETYGSIPQFFDPLTTDPSPTPPVNNSLSTFSLGVDQRWGDAAMTLNWISRARQDHTTAVTTHSSQLRTQVTVPIQERLKVGALNETTLSATADTVYPDRTALGLSWEVADQLFLDVSQNWYSDATLGQQSFTTLGLRGEYPLGTDAQVFTRYALVSGLSSVTQVGSIGFQYRWSIAPGLAADLGYERVFSDYRPNGSGNPPPIYTVGSQGWSLGVESGENYRLGLTYTENPDFKASVRYDQSNTTAGSNAVFTLDALGKVSPTLTALLHYQQASSANVSFNGRLDPTINLRLGLAYRDPQEDRWNSLLRYEYRKNPSSVPDALLLDGGSQFESHLLALEVLYAPDWQWELYGKVAFRTGYTQLGQDLGSLSNTGLTQFRATYRPDYRWELMTEARWIQQPSAGYRETGFVAEAGYFLTPDVKVAIGYNSGSVDQDFGDSRWAQGLYAGLTIKVNDLFNGFGLQPTPAIDAAKAEPAAPSPQLSLEPRPDSQPHTKTEDSSTPEEINWAAIYQGAFTGFGIPSHLSESLAADASLEWDPEQMEAADQELVSLFSGVTWDCSTDLDCESPTGDPLTESVTRWSLPVASFLGDIPWHGPPSNRLE